jgi:uncharacterized protein YndB with AHSA1/START domain
MSTNNDPDRVLTLTRVFDAPRPLVFEAWTKKEYLDHWSAPHGFTIPSSEGDLRPGGTWRCIMRSPDGVEHQLGGVYREIVKDELLVFTHAWAGEDGRPGQETLVTVRFADEGGGTKVTFEQAGFESVESRDSHRGGWMECFDRLRAHLAKLQAQSGI